MKILLKIVFKIIPMKTYVVSLILFVSIVPQVAVAQLKKTDKIVPREGRMEQKEVQKISVDGTVDNLQGTTNQTNNFQDGSVKENIDAEIKEQVTVQTTNGIKTVTVTKFENGNQTVTVLQGLEGEAKIRDFESKGGKVKEINSIKKVPPSRVPKNH